MLSRAQSLLLLCRKHLNEELFFKTIMNLREMTPSEITIYKAVNFPDGSAPCIGSFLNITWIAILDYTGLTIRSIDNPEKCYIIPYRTRSSTELSTVLSNTLDSLVSLTSEAQLYDRDYLALHKFQPKTNQFG